MGGRTWLCVDGRASQYEQPFVQKTAEVPEEGTLRQAHVNGVWAGLELTDEEDNLNANMADKDFKLVFLKGLFRYMQFASCVPMLSYR